MLHSQFPVLPYYSEFFSSVCPTLCTQAQRSFMMMSSITTVKS